MSSSWREREKEAFKTREGVNLTFLPIVVLSVCGALREFPMVNATWAGDRIIVRKQINVGIAVDIEDGLVVPVVRDADHMSLSGVARKIVELVEKARSRKLTMPEMSDGTITVDNTGALGSIASVSDHQPSASRDHHDGIDRQASLGGQRRHRHPVDHESVL